MSVVLVGCALLLSGLARVAVGMGFVSRWYAYPPLALACAYIGFGIAPATPIFAAAMAMTVGFGWTQWGNRLWMAARYGIPPLVLTVAYSFAHPLPLEMFIWALSCTAYGALDGDVRRLLEPYSFTVRGHAVSSAQYAEFLTGAILLGGMALL